MASLLFAWVPVIGDALTVIAGTLRVSLMPFTFVVGIGKLCRYLAVGAGALDLSSGGS
jgi:membrane protein YqaA with SNARE-associated domain